MVPKPPTTARPQSARPVRSFTPRPPFDHEQWVVRCVTRREEDWRRRNVLLAMQAYGCATANAKKLHELSFKDYVAGVGAFKAGGDPFRTFKGLKPLSTRESAFEKQRLLALRKRMALLEPPKPKPARAKPNYAQEVLNEVTDEELIQAQKLLRQLVKEKWKTFRQAFFALDEDRSGKVDVDEFMRIVMHGNLEDVIRPQTLRVLMGQIDINNDGTLGSCGPCDDLPPFASTYLASSRTDACRANLALGQITTSSSQHLRKSVRSHAFLACRGG